MTHIKASIAGLGDQVTSLDTEVAALQSACSLGGR